jgi:hypothetical protein
MAMNPELFSARIFGILKDPVRVTDGNLVNRCKIGPSLFVDKDFIAHGLAHVYGRGKILVVYLDSVQRVLGEIAAFGNGNGNRLTYITDLVFGKKRLEITLESG